MIRDVRPSVKWSWVSPGFAFGFVFVFDALVVFPALDEVGRDDEDATDASARFFVGGVLAGIVASPFFTVVEDLGTRKSSKLTRTPGPAAPETCGLGEGFTFALRLPAATFSAPSAVTTRFRFPKLESAAGLTGDEGGDGDDDSNANDAFLRGDVRDVCVSSRPAGSEEYDERGEEGRAIAGRVVRLDPYVRFTGGMVQAFPTRKKRFSEGRNARYAKGTTRK